MCARRIAETRSPAQTGADAVVMIGALLAWLVAAVAVSEGERWSLLAVAPPTLVFGLLVGAVTRAAATPDRGRPGTAGRAAVAVALGVAVGELAALVIFARSIDHRLDERALRSADSAPAVGRASASLQQARDARAGLDRAVERAREHQDRALVVARCEYHPTPPCPQTRITGVPGAGPETRTANELLADAQRELDDALAARDGRAPELDAAVAREEHALTQARDAAVADADRGLGARWVAMNGLTLASAAAMALRLVTIAFCALLYLLPLILRRWRAETSRDRRQAALADRERADLEADTAIAIKRAQVRREAEILWAEHQLTQARLAIEAQTEIDRERQRRRVAEALEAPVPPSRAMGQGPAAPSTDDDIYLPIAAEAEAASRAIAAAPPPEPPVNLPAPVEQPAAVEPHEERATPPIPAIPSIPHATKAAARWIRPLVPPLVARVVDNTTHPLRTARQAFEGVIEEVFEEDHVIRFSLKRTRRLTVNSETTGTAGPGAEPTESRRDERRRETPRPVGGHRHRPSARAVAGCDRGPELPRRDEAGELRASEGPRQLPPGD
ncbi:DUF4407 domain-containing protein [Mycobacterium alsense]|uniref:DUF4407 domain-containing protein n=1 Tax=Mycobacterium alsense TaxID=324058 RepID=A0AA41XLM8_9MYCO|nr:DUF4407 domain-containing protein [Mycobacterium alsense]MCV7377370.1 DUF4407 domain-containing protein [Mycobacterium alsense]